MPLTKIEIIASESTFANLASFTRSLPWLLFSVSAPHYLIYILEYDLGIWRRRIPFKKGKRFGNVVQKIAGVIIIMIGLFDIITYW
ncbi:hypothetical protein [Peribacillus glennii]|uniref:Uncharacterized protein n=1 Tax=Peribacillus glennii TaxID=2303991 RepID=A0A372L8C8_9BACI|nr:hypothetical protein [Peribacillus glennii]RFU61282.1 hypothetical protein D0466_18905 [Peribacillus glennii]